MTVDLTNTRVHPDADRTYECRLTWVGTKTRPEVVIPIRAPIEGAGMKRKSMSYGSEERDEERKSNDANHEE